MAAVDYGKFIVGGVICLYALLSLIGVLTCEEK